MTSLKIYDSLSQRKRLFQPREAGKVSIYVCGMTVYDYCHIGHARVLVGFDLITRYLRYRGYEVTYVRNITDIDDKIIKRAQENNESYQQLTQRFIDAMHEDERALGVLPPDIEPCATEHIEQMISMINTLFEKEIAYIANNGDVCYDITRFPGYGALAHQDLDSLQTGARVEIDTAKRNPLDFVLWKLAKPGEPHWSSPWGDGRPGWHIECSAMATHYLGKQLDMHGGGADLQFPHHQNELAQAEAACGCTFVNNWLHIGHIRVNQEKMSKSLGNFFTVRDVLKDYSPETIRYFILASHYRSPVNYSTDNLNSAQAALTRLYTALRHLPETAVAPTNEDSRLSQYEARFIETMDDDFNTPEALAVLFDLAREINRLTDAGSIVEAAGLALGFKQLGGVLGLLQQSPDDFLQAGINDSALAEIEAMIEARNKARAAKDFARADEIRKSLAARGISIEDDATGKTTWKRHTT